MATKFPARTKDTSTTSGTGTYTLADSTAAGYRNLTRAVTDGDLADGDIVYYAVVDTSVTGGPKLVEISSGVWNNTAKTLTRATVYQPNGAAVNWAAGTRDIFVIDAQSIAYMVGSNNLSEIASAATARLNLGLGTIATYAAERFGLIISGQSGGTAGKVVRMTTTASTWQDASQADTIDQLVGLALKMAEGYYLPGSYVAGLSGLTAGTSYYLSTAGNLTSTAPTISGSVRRVFIGKAISTTVLHFTPGLPIGG